MGLNSISGGLTICLVCYLFHRLKKLKNRKIVFYIILCIIFVFGIAGLFYNALEGINFVIVGIIMIFICSKSHHPGGGGEHMYIRGWIAAIASLTYGILKILNMI